MLNFKKYKLHFNAFHNHVFLSFPSSHASHVSGALGTCHSYCRHARHPMNNCWNCPSHLGESLVSQKCSRLHENQTRQESGESSQILLGVILLTFGLFPSHMLIIDSVFCPHHIFIRFQLHMDNLLLLNLLRLRLDEDSTTSVTSCFLDHFKLKLFFTF